MDLRETIKYRDRYDERFPVIHLYYIIHLTRTWKSTTQELREVACDERMGSAVMKTEASDGGDSSLNEGTSLVFRYKGVALITQQESADLLLIPCLRYKSRTEIFICGFNKNIIVKTPLERIFRFNIKGSVVSIQIRHIQE